MESCLKFIPRKSYNTFGYVVLVMFSLTALALIGITSDLNTKSQLSCNPSKKVAVDFSQKAFVETTCSLKYEQTYNVPLPLYKFVILNFGLVFALCIVYAFVVKARVEYWDEPTTTDDVELQPLSQHERSQPDQDNTNHGIPVYYIYLCHLLFFRLVPMILFVVLVLYPADFPTNFSCPWLLPGTSSIYGNITDNIKKQLNFTTVDCKNPLGSTSTSLAKAVWIVDIIFSIVTLVEVVYLVWQNCKDNRFARDSVFCAEYLRGRNVLKLIKNYKNKLASDKTVFKLDVLSLAKGTLDGMYVKLIIQTGREKQPQHSDIHEMYQAYLVPPQDSISVEKMEDLFFNKEGTRCHKILVVGRPGIGKTILTKNILHQWTTSEDKFWSEKLVILLHFRTFNEEQNKVTTLKNMFRLGVGLPTGSDFDDMYKFILTNPEKVILIFHGLDELDVDKNCWKNAEDTPDQPDDYNECMPIFSILKKLIFGKFLPTITVLITSRPTANHLYDRLTFESRFEILGFTKLEIQDYVKKFCQSDEKLNTRMWNLIEVLPELLSLCYIPASCFIICLTLKKCIEHEDSGFSIPTTMTELYQRAVRIILWDHNPTHKNKPKKRDYMKTSLPGDLKDTLDMLKTLAKTGMEERKLIFEIKSDDDLYAMKDCGLFNSLENDESHHFSFLHLTIQEFLTAMELVDKIVSPEDVGLFLLNHIGDPNWHLVIQFFAGLLADKFREDKSSMEKMCESFVQQISSITSPQVTNVERKVSLLMIKCLYEMQECGIMESAASKVDGGGGSGCDLSWLHIAPIDCTGLFQLLSHVNNLEKINLFQNNIGENGCLELAKFLCRSNIVTELNLGDNDIEDEGVKHLCDALINVNCKLTNLDLTYNSIKDEGAKHLCDTLIHENCKLTNLNIGGNDIEDEGVKHLCDVGLIHENCKLTNLNLGGNDIEDKGVKHLYDALIHENCKLTNLNLGGNDIEDKGVKHLYDALIHENCKLTNLNLSDNERVKHLYDALIHENCKLANLNLSSNKINDEGVKHLCHALINVNCKLTNLDLSFNEIKDEGVKHLCAALKNENCKLTNLDLSSNERC